MEEITKDNWLHFAKDNYDNTSLDRDVEFEEDLKRFKYLKRLFRKYDLTNELKVRLVVNHIVVLQNVFGAEACVTLLLYHIERKHWPVIKPVLDYLKYIHPTELNEVESDKNILKLLEDI